MGSQSHAATSHSEPRFDSWAQASMSLPTIPPSVLVSWARVSSRPGELVAICLPIMQPSVLVKGACIISACEKCQHLHRALDLIQRSSNGSRPWGMAARLQLRYCTRSFPIMPPSGPVKGACVISAWEKCQHVSLKGSRRPRRALQ